MSTLRDIRSIATETFSNWNKHNAPRLGASLAFYTIVSLAPIVILVISLASLVFGHTAAQEQILQQVHNMIGEDGARGVQEMLEHAKKPSSSMIASILGVITLLLGASGVLTELRDALNLIWEAKAKPGSNLMNLLREKFLSFGMVLALGFLALVSLLVSAGLAIAARFFGHLLPLPVWALSSVNYLVSLAGISVMFALIFRYVPQSRINWRDVWKGAIATAVLFTIGKLLIGLYLGKASVGSPYGAAGSIVVIVVWVYYSAQIFFLGAEFTWVLEQRKRRAMTRGTVST